MRRSTSLARHSSAAGPVMMAVVAILGTLGVLLVPLDLEAAVDDFIGKPIGSVRLLVGGRETMETELVRVIETSVGQPLAMSAVRDTLTHLFSLGRFDDVRVDASLNEAGRVALRYELSPLRFVTRIDFAGTLSLPGLDTGQLRRGVVDRYGASPPIGRAAAAAAVVSDLLSERGYLHAEVRPRVEIQHAPGRATLVFTIAAGARTAIGSIDVVGAPALPRAELLHRLRLTRGAPYQRDALNARIDRYVAERRKAGYYEAKLMAAPWFADGDSVANLILTVMPGPHVRVVFMGDPLSSDQRMELVPIEQEGSVDEDLLEDSTNRIVDYLRRQGYRDAMAPHSRVESGGELRITFDVKRGRQYRVDRVEISGNRSVPLADLEPALRLRAGEPFAQSRLDADLATIQDLYRRRGFAAARAQPAEEPQTAEPGVAFVPLRVRIDVNEGPQTLVSLVHIEGNTAISESTLKEGLGLQPGRPYLDARLALDADAIQGQYFKRGYPSATVDADPKFSADRTSAEPVFTVREGPRIVVDHVLIVGNVRTSAATIEREFRIKSGDPLSEAAKFEGRQRLATLGLFRRVQVTELALGDEGRRDLIVTVEESPPTTVEIGGGVEGRVRVVPNNQGVASERFEIAPRGSLGIARRNLFGKNRSVSLFSSVSLPLFKEPVFGVQGTLINDQLAVPEYRVIGTYREPRVFDTAVNALVTGTFEQQARSSFNFARRGASAELERRVKRQIRLSASYQIQRTIVFDDNVSPADQLLVDRLFPQVRLSSVSSSATRDTRDDLVDPGAGDYVSANVQLAARSIGSEVGLAKTYMRAQLFRTMPGGKRIVLAGNATLGLAAGFPRAVLATDAQGHVTTQTIEDLPVSERFFAGGDTTVRGFALDALGRPQTIGQNGFPIGGNGMVIFNVEVRVPVRGAISAVGFFDSGNVFAHASDIDLTELRSAVGFGIRYKSPVGPIRVDLGFKVHPEEIAGSREPLTALHISLGQAF
jgi:outer membrane protein insertion porin family